MNHIHLLLSLYDINEIMPTINALCPAAIFLHQILLALSRRLQCDIFLTIMLLNRCGKYEQFALLEFLILKLEDEALPLRQY